MKRILLLLLFAIPILVTGQRLKIGKQLEKAPGINYMVLTDINGEQYYTPMASVLGSINTDQSLGTVTLSGNNLVITERNVLTGAVIATYTINLAPYMQSLTAVDNGNGTVTLNMTGDASPELIDICNIVSTHCNAGLTVSPTGLVTFTDNAGNVLNFNLVSPAAGNDITYNNGFYFSETVTAISYNPTTHALSYINEAGVTNTITLDVAGLTFNAGTNTLTYTAENGVVTNIVLPADVVTTITNTIVGNRIATYTNENGVAVDIDETITTIVNNGDGTYTYTNEAGATATFPAQANTDTRLSISVVNDSLRVDVVNIVTGATVSTSYIDNVINHPDILTTLAYNSTTHTLTYTDENGGTTNLPLDVATMTYNVATNTITYTAENGTVTNIALPVETVTTITNTVTGHKIADYTNELGAVMPINETIIDVSLSGNTLTITDEAGVPHIVPLPIDSTVVTSANSNIVVTETSPNTFSLNFTYDCDSITNCLAPIQMIQTPVIVAGDTIGYETEITGPLGDVAIDTMYFPNTFDPILDPMCTTSDEHILVKRTDGTFVLRSPYSIFGKQVFPSGNYTILPDDEVIYAQGGSTITLPNCSGNCNEKTIYRDACSDGLVKVLPPSGQTIDGVHQSRILQVGRGAFTYECVNGNWRIKSEFFEPDASCCEYSVLNSPDANVQVWTTDGQPYSVDWGDGSNSGPIASGVATSHAYAGNFTGNIKICKTCGVAPIYRVYFNSGNWNFDINNLNCLSGLKEVAIYTGVTSGDIANLPSGLTWYLNYGQNTTSGDIANLPSGLTYYSNYGQNTTSGDITNLPSGLTFYANYGQNTVSDYSGGNLNSGITYFLSIPTSGGLSSAEVDALFIELETTLPGIGFIQITGTNSAPTAASLTARNNLIAAGTTVIHN
jgi:hypothetical protein